MIQFSIQSIQVTVQGWFFLLTAFLGGALGATTPEHWGRVLLFMLAAFISILIHELGHAFSGLKQGAHAARIELHGMGGVTSFQGTQFSRRQRILLTAAGPGASIALALVVFLMGNWIFDESIAVPDQVRQFFLIMLTINIFWTVINLCPVLPLDGGQMLRDLLGPSRLRLTCLISFVTLGILALLLWQLTRSYYNLIIMVLLGSYTWNVYRNA